MKTSEINIQVSQNIILKGILNIPYEPCALVIFSHGSGSSRFSKRNKYVAEQLNNNNIATLLVDLLTEKEDSVYENRFNIGLLADRLTVITDYVTQFSDLKHLPVGYFGASTGAASALMAAAYPNDKISAIVSRGGRPDLAVQILPKVKAPTLLIVGSLDEDVILLNNTALARLNCEKDIQIVKGASHLFEESGKLEEVAELALKWFNKYLVFNFDTV